MKQCPQVGMRNTLLSKDLHVFVFLFFVKDQIIDILHFGTILSVVIAQLCQVAQKQPQTNEQGVL